MARLGMVIDTRRCVGCMDCVVACKTENGVPFDEGRLLAAGIRGSTFVPLPSRNHLLLEHEPAWTIFLRELGTFLAWPERAQPHVSPAP